VAVQVPTTEWFLVTDASARIAAATSEGRDIIGRFRGAFALTSVAALLAACAVVAIVAQTDRLARQRARFAAAAAHELKTPLTSLRLHGEMLSEGLGDPDRWPTYAARILPETSRLARVVSNMLDLSRLERGAPLANPVAGDVGPAVGHCIDRLRPSMDDAGLPIRLDCAENLPRVLFDRDALCQILDNLLDNAEKYTRQVTDRSVKVSVTESVDNVRIVVSDNGPGISRRAKHGLFRPFERPADADAPAGLGLGLALARSLARAQGGDLRLADTGSAGATFELTLPRAQG
jgi:signal transduction histidine kinase